MLNKTKRLIQEVLSKNINLLIDIITKPVKKQIYKLQKIKDEYINIKN